jgi:hypothetical protein
VESVVEIVFFDDHQALVAAYLAGSSQRVMCADTTLRRVQTGW